MHLTKYHDPKEAFRIMNDWTQVTTSYETQFLGRTITKVTIMYDRDKPRYVSVHYRHGDHLGVESIDLSQKMLLDMPKERAIDFLANFN